MARTEQLEEIGQTLIVEELGVERDSSPTPSFMEDHRDEASTRSSWSCSKESIDIRTKAEKLRTRAAMSYLHEKWGKE